MNPRLEWLPHIERSGEPLYRQIARALTNDIRSGRLAPGALLPAQRDLAAALSVTTSTVTRAYSEVARLNLVGGRARAGTHVVQRAASVAGWRGTRPDGAASVDLASNSVGVDGFLHELATTLPALSGSDRFADLQEYPPVAGHLHHRRIIAEWLRGRGIQSEPEQIVITGGAHQGLAAVLATLAREGATLAAEDTNYVPLGPLAKSVGLPVNPLPGDDEGVDWAAETPRLRRLRKPAVFVVPNIANPTTATMSAARRRALVATARRADARIVEDDVCALLAERELPAVAAMAPERVFYVSSFAKSVAPGLRMGFVRAPDRMSANSVAAAVGLSTRMAPSLYVDIACAWLADGTLSRIVEAHRAELEQRVLLARRTFRRFDLRSARYGPYVWLRLPAGIDEHAVVAAAAGAGVLVLGSEQFSLRGQVLGALRLTLTPPRSRDELTAALRTVRDTISQASTDGGG